MRDFILRHRNTILSKNVKPTKNKQTLSQQTQVNSKNITAQKAGKAVLHCPIWRHTIWDL